MIKHELITRQKVLAIRLINSILCAILGWQTTALVNAAYRKIGANLDGSEGIS